jgi:hypothetical protein
LINVHTGLQVVKGGLFNEKEVTKITELENPLSKDIFLIARSRDILVSYKVRQSDGSILYSIDQLGNPKSLSMMLGRQFQEKSSLLSSQVGTCSSNRDSLYLYKIFEGTIFQHFTKVKSYYLGPEALSLFNQGFRLCCTLKASKIYDLVR